jgi:hypothetical protein
MDYFKDNYPDELKQFYQDEKYKQEIEGLQKDKTKLKSKVRFLDGLRK